MVYVMNTIFTATDSSAHPERDYLAVILQAYRDKLAEKRRQKPLPKIKINQTLSSLALIYEKIRTAVDFRDERLFRRAAIERILRRYLLAGKSRPELLARGLIKELVWGRYLPNNAVPIEKIPGAAQIIQKHQQLKKQVSGSKSFFDKQAGLFLELLSTEVDEFLVDQREDEAWAVALGQWFRWRFAWLDPLPDREKEALVYIAIRQAFLKSDKAIIRYHFFRRAFPQWAAATDVAISQIARQFPSWQKRVEFYFNHPARGNLFRFVKEKTVPFLVLREVVEKNWPDSEQLLQNKKQLRLQIKRVCARRYRQIGRRVSRGIVRSIIYIFATKMLFAFFLEVPYEMWALKRISWLPLSINLAFPPTLMFFLGQLIHPPGRDNTRRIVRQVQSFLAPGLADSQEAFQFAKRRQSRFAPVFRLFYFILFIAVFGGVSWLLWRLGFNILSGAIFFLFVSLVLLFGYRIRWAANELRVTGKHEGFVESIISIVSLPFLNLGVKLSVGISRLNILIFILDFLIEAPLKLIIDVVGRWVAFMRQKRAEVVEVPF